MWRDLSSNICRRSSWVSSHHAADFRIGISAAQVASGRPSPACSSASRVLLGALGIAQMADDPGQPPRGLRRQQRQGDGLGRHHRKRRHGWQRRALHGRQRDDPPRAALATSEGREHALSKRGTGQGSSVSVILRRASRAVNSGEKANNLRILPRPPYIHDRLARTSYTGTHHPMRFTPQFLDDLRARLPVSEVVGRRVKLKRAGQGVEGAVAVPAGEVAVLHGQRPEGILPRLLLRQARRHHLLPDGDRGRRLHRGGGAAGADGRPGAAGRRPPMPRGTSSAARRCTT